MVSPAVAEPLAEAIARHGDADIAALRSQAGEPAARCALGAVYAKRGDLSRAALYLDKCDDAPLPDDIAPVVSRTIAEVERKLRVSDLAVLEIVTHPELMVAEIDALPGDRFTTPATLWIKPGNHEVRAANDAAMLDAKQGVATRVATEAHKRSSIVIEAGARAPRAAKPGKADFDEGELGETHDGPPPAAEHKPLMPIKYRNGIATPEPKPDNWIDDPLDPTEKIAISTEPPAHRLSLRAGAGAFHHAGDGRVGIDLGLEHHVIAPWESRDAAHPFELVARVDWSQRGDVDDAVNVLGATAGLDKVVARPGDHRLALALGLRGDLRLADSLAMQPVHRLGVDAIAGAELALATAPIVVGARYELGLTPLVPGAREQAVIFEVGFELRVR